MTFSKHTALLACLAGATLTHAGASFAAGDTFFDAALCKPPYTTTSATAVYKAAEKVAKSEMVGMMAVYKLPKPVVQDGFEAQEVVFASSTVGVLLKGSQADALAAKYALKPEAPNPLRGAGKAYARELPAAQQPDRESGTVSVVARESAAIPGKTVLACEFTSK